MRRVVALLLVVLVGGSCSSGPGDEGADADTTTTVAASLTQDTDAGTTTTTTAPVSTLPAGDPEALATQLVGAESRIRSPSTPQADLPVLGHAAQVAYRQLVAHPEWTDAVRARLPADLAPVMEAHVDAGAKLRTLVTDLKDAPPADWLIVDPPPADALLSYYKDAENRTAIPWHYLASIHLVEPRMGRIRGTSTAGAKGPMQFIDSTWARWASDGDGDGVSDVNNAHDAVLAAARYLQAAGGPGDMRRAIFAYNHADAYVDAVVTYARAMASDERRFFAYHGWQVYYMTTQGDVLLPVGYGSTNQAQQQ